MESYGNYPIFIDRQWSLDDLHVFPKAYEQVYYAYEALLPKPDQMIDQRIARAFHAFPWRGGYSAVNFYNQLKFATPKRERPTVRAIKYNSPGFIELSLNISLALEIAAAVVTIAGSIGACNKLYHQIYTDSQKRKLLSLDLRSREIELANQELDFIIESNQKLSNLLQITSPDAIEELSPHPLIAMKIMLSVYRRSRILAEYQENGKVNLPTNDL
jgi:hypothetical protein